MTLSPVTSQPEQPKRQRPVIAIDGPAGAGKSTLAAHLARRFGFLNLETGAMYRALALKAIENDFAFDEEAPLLDLASHTHITLEPQLEGNRVLLDGIDVSRRIREQDVTSAASQISVHHMAADGLEDVDLGGDHEITENIVHLVLARTPDAPPGVKGISLFLVPKHRVEADGSLGPRNGIELAGLNHKMGHRGTTNCLLNFGESGETIGFLVGEQHRGLAYMFHMMNEARIGVGHGATMSGLAGFLYSLDYARERRQGRRPQDKDPSTPQIPIIEHADVKRMLMAQKAAVEGALALCSFCALLVDQEKASADPAEKAGFALLLDLLTPVAKSWPSEHCLEANKWAIQVLGGYGYTRDYPVERFYRDNRLNHIHEGAYGVQALDLLGRKVRMGDGAALKLLLARLDETIGKAEAVEDLKAEAAALKTAAEALQNTTAVVLACADLNVGLANATLYLDAFGQVVVAWLWLEQALTATRAIEEASDHAFYAGKLAACRYFFRYDLPGAHVQFALVRALDETCLELGPEQFIGA